MPYVDNDSIIWVFLKVVHSANKTRAKFIEMHWNSALTEVFIRIKIANAFRCSLVTNSLSRLLCIYNMRLIPTHNLYEISLIISVFSLSTSAGLLRMFNSTWGVFFVQRFLLAIEGLCVKHKNVIPHCHWRIELIRSFERQGFNCLSVNHQKLNTSCTDLKN